MNKNIFEVILLIALPASGKSEVRRFFKNISSEELEKDFHIGKNIQLDDFPYVHVMRRIDEELSKRGLERIFFQSPEKPFKNPYDWQTLIELINMDWRDLKSNMRYDNKHPGVWLMERIETAALKVRIPKRISLFENKVFNSIAEELKKEGQDILNDKYSHYTDDFSDKTIIIEFARGGQQGSKMPLSEPFGYLHSLPVLDEDILEKAVILYIWVTPEESRRKNQERANPNDPGSILHHGVPIDVMLNDYGCDDIFWLYENSDRRDNITVKKNNKTFYLPFAYFDNRVDKTSFLREDKHRWDEKKLRELRTEIKKATDSLYNLKFRI
ncbi:MAG: hypothetical protein N2446_03240 [Elusimicrobiales bacterium]|nr:hypothetical protein [Elusimicrobiales bacterium]